MKRFLCIFFACTTVFSIVLFLIYIGDARNLETKTGVKVLNFENVFLYVVFIILQAAVSGLFLFAVESSEHITKIITYIKSKKEKNELEQNTTFAKEQIDELKKQIKELQDSFQKQNDNNK